MQLFYVKCRYKIVKYISKMLTLDDVIITFGHLLALQASLWHPSQTHGTPPQIFVLTLETHATRNYVIQREAETLDFSFQLPL